MAKWLAIFLLFCLPFVVSAEGGHPHLDVTFYLEDEPVYTSSDPEQPGLLNEIMDLIATYLDIHESRVYLPWKRAQLLAMKTRNALIFPLARTPSREESYRWLFKVVEVPTMFITVEGLPQINTIEQAKALRGIGVIRGTPQEEFLVENTISHVTFTGETLLESLASGEVNAIYTAAPEASVAWLKLKEDKKLVMGESIQTLPLWVAASKNSPDIDSEVWLDALQHIRENGKLEAILTRYFGNSSGHNRL